MPYRPLPYYARVPCMCLLLILSMHTVCAQVNPVEFNRLDIRQGLSHNQVRNIIKDKQGFLWFATLSGLNRYDGYQFKIFRHSAGDSTTLSDDNIQRMFACPDGKIWIDTHNGYNIYDPVTESIDRDIAGYCQKIGIPNQTLTHAAHDKADNYWFLTGGRALFAYRHDEKKAVLIYEQSASAAPLTSFAQDSHGFIWLVHNDGLIEKLDPNAKKIIAGPDLLKKIFNNETLNYSIFIDIQDELWLFAATDDRGVFHYNPVTGFLEQINKESKPYHLNNNIVVSILQDDSDNIWISTDHGGINILNKQSSTIRYLLNNVDDGKSLSENSISSAYKDDAGIIWIGTYKQGINYYHADILKFPLFRHIPSDSHSLQYSDINAFAEDEKGNIWIGTNGGGLVYFDRSSNRFVQYKHSATNPNSLTNDVIVCLYMDRRRRLWIGTYYGGLDCYDGTTFTHYRHDLSDSNSLSDDRVYDILEDSRDNIWIGTLSAGLDRLDQQHNVFHHYKGYAPNSVHTFYVSELMEDSEGNIWVGSSNGIDVLNKKTGTFENYYSNFKNDPNGLSNNNILSLMQDSRGLIWAGTSDGLNVFDPKDKSFTAFRTGDGLPGNTILTILEDAQRHLWVSTANGLSSVRILEQTNGKKPKIACSNYDVADGLQGTAFNENACLKTHYGELAFGGANGFNLFDPGTISHDKNVPSVVLTDLQIFNKSVGIGEKIDGQTVLPKALSHLEELNLKYDQDVFSVEFAALNFLSPEKNKYAYKLEGFDKGWIFPDGKTRKASYTNLDPGHYTFMVKAASSDGVWNDKSVDLQITILPPFWKTPLAYLLYLTAAIALLWFARRIELQRARMRFIIEQQKQEAQRMHELDMLKIKFITNVSHEFRTPLSLILSPMEKLIGEAADDLSRRDQLQLVHRNARRLLNLVNQLLDFRKMEVQELRLHATQGDIVRFIREITQSFADIAEKKNISLVCHSTIDSLQMPFDHDKLERILFNLLSNAFKFTGESGRVGVSLQLQMEDGKQVLAINISDTGIGIDADKKQKIFERFFQNDIPDSLVNQGSGIGLAITKEFVKLHNGMIVVESEPGKGSCFTVILPVEEVPAITVMPEPVQETAEDAIVTAVAPVATGGQKKLTLLIVEDNEDFLFYLKDNLKQYFSVLEATNGKAGWQKALGERPSLVVADISMPEMNGIDLCRKIKNDPRTAHIPVILLTALTGDQQQIKGLETGASDYLTKPFNFEILLSRIKNILEEQIRLQQTFGKRVPVKATDIAVPSADEQFVAHAIEVVEKNMSDPAFSVGDMSRYLFMSRVTLYKKLLALTGKTPLEFIRSFRLQRAAQLLEKSQLTIAEVAYEVGYNNPKSFSRYFKTEFNLSPSSYPPGKKTVHPTGPSSPGAT